MTPSHTIESVPPGGTAQAFGWLDRWPVILLVCLAAITPLLLVDFPPLVDLYGHLGRYAVQTELAERPALQPFFTYEWKLIGNLGGDILVQVLHPLFGLEGAVRITVILTQFLGALGLMLVAREVHGRVTPLSLVAIPLLYGYPFNYGFINYALSMALGLLAFVMWLRLHRQGRNHAAGLWLAVAGLTVWVCHTYGWALLGLLVGSSMLADQLTTRAHPVKAVRRILAVCWPLLLPVIPMVVWRAESSGAALSNGTLFFKLHYLISPLRTKWNELDVGSLAVVAGLIVILPMLGRLFTLDLRLRIAALLCFACYFVMPSQVFGSAFADMRLVPYAFMLALLAIRPDRIGPKALQAVTIIALGLLGARLAIVGAAYVEQDRKVQAALPALEKMPDGARVAFFVVKPCLAAWALPVLDHLAGAAMARRNAFVNDQWQRPGVNPLRVSYPAAEPFTRDPSHLVQREDCSHSVRPKLSTSLAKIPRAAFTHIWIVGEYRSDWPAPEGYELVPGTGDSLLFARKPEPRD